MSSPLSNASNFINTLREQYSGGVIFGEESVCMSVGESITNNGFIGSKNVVFLSSKSSIEHKAPGCVAAPLINMVAKNSITLGNLRQDSHSIPVRIFAPNQLSISTNNLTIGGVVKILTEPKDAAIFCRVLTLIKQSSEEKDPDYFERIRSYVLNDDVKVVKTVLSSSSDERKSS